MHKTTQNKIVKTESSVW